MIGFAATVPLAIGVAMLVAAEHSGRASMPSGERRSGDYDGQGRQQVNNDAHHIPIKIRRSKGYDGGRE